MGRQNNINDLRGLTGTRSRTHSRRRANAALNAAFAAPLELLETRVLLTVGLDPTFGTGGFTATDVGGATNEAYAVAVQADGKILIAGCVALSDGCDFALARYNADGTLDTSFGGGDGVVTTDFGSFNDIAYAMTIQEDGKIVLVGQTDGGATSYDMAVARYNADGSLDTSFAGDGTVTLDFDGSFDQGFAVMQLTSGQLVVGGVAADALTFNFEFALARLNADGTLDTSFGGTGKVMTDVAPYGGSGYALVQAGSEIVMGGYAYGELGADWAMARYNTDGSLAGLSLIDGGSGDESIKSMVAVGNSVDGYKIVAAGYSGDDMAVARLNLDGTVDSSFNSGSVLAIDFGGDRDLASSVVVTASGGMLVVGAANTWTNGDVAIASVRANGTLDSAFDGDGLLTADIGSIDDNGRGAVLDADGRLVVAGTTIGANATYDWFVARFDVITNLPPVANAGGPQSVVEGSSVNLSGSASSDPDGTIVSWEWDFNYDGTFNADATGSEVVLSGLDGPAIRTIALRVTDDKGDSHLVTTTVTVSNAAPVVSAGEDGSVEIGGSVTIVGNFTDASPLDTHVTSWSVLDSNGASVASGDGMSAVFTPSAAGTYTVTFTVTDDDGASSSDSMDLVVSEPPPVVIPASAGADQATNEGACVLLSGSAEGESLSYLWTVLDANGVLVAQSDDLSFQFVPMDNGVYTATFTATDADGNSGSDSAVITVANVAPLNVSVQRISGSDDSMITLRGTWSDPGAADTHLLHWRIEAKNGDLMAEGTGEEFTFVPTNRGYYRVILTVTDDDGGTAVHCCLMRAKDSASDATAMANGDTRRAGGNKSTLTAAVSDDSVEESSLVSWDFGDGTQPGRAESIEAVVTQAFARSGKHAVKARVKDSHDRFARARHAVNVRADFERSFAPTSRAIANGHGADDAILVGRPISVAAFFHGGGMNSVWSEKDDGVI